jgi:hypothetical protein
MELPWDRIGVLEKGIEFYSVWSTKWAELII